MLPIASRRAFLAAATAAMATTKLLAASSQTPSFLYMGSTSKGEGSGIRVATWNDGNGTLAQPRIAFSTDAASFLATARNSSVRYLFAGHQSAPKVGALSAFRIESSGDLKLINTITIPEFDAVHTVVDPTITTLISVSYGSGKLLSCKIAVDGTLSSPVSQFQLNGHGPNATRQITTHAHGICIAPGNRFALINDLGTDKIMIYKLNPATAELTPNDPAFFMAVPGAGPRHLVFHPTGKWAYSINELNSTITRMAWNGKRGTLTLLDSTPTLPPGADIALNRAGELAFDKVGLTLYASNRGTPEELLVFKVALDGGLTLSQRLPLGGKEARHFTISPDEGFFVVAEQFSNAVAVFRRNSFTGTLGQIPTQGSAHYPVPNASCVVFG